MAAQLTGQTKARRPNLVFLFSDQQSSDMVGCYGNEQVRTPHIDRFARDSQLFEHCISNSPVCTPYRGILMSGQHHLYSGAIANDYQMIPGNGNYFGEVLRDAGYRQGYVGKWHLYGGDRNRPIPPGPYRYGFDGDFLSNNCTLEFRAGRAYYWNKEGRKVTYDVWEPYGQARQAVEFIDECSRPENAAQPFALFVSWHPPHSWQGIGHYAAPPDLVAQYDPAKIRVRPTVEDTPEMRRMYQGYMALCSSIDLAFGQVVDRLHERGLDGDTIVVYTADHGDMLLRGGSRMEKGHPTADSCRIPFLVRWPGKLQPGRRQLVVSSIDLMPSLLGLLGLGIPKTCQGRNLAAAIREGRDEASEAAPLFLNIAEKVNWRGIYTRRYTYSLERPGTVGTKPPDQFNRLYDREKDPHELNNLFDAREYRGLQQKLDRETKAWMERFHDTFVDHSVLAHAVLANSAEADAPALGGPGKTGKLKGRPIDLLLVMLLLAFWTRPASAGPPDQPPHVAPADEVCVVGESLKLSSRAPKSWNVGTVLKGIAANTNGRISPPGAFDAAKLVIRKNGTVYQEGKDYLVDHEWGTLGLAPGSRLTPDDVVTADYCFSERRLDSRIRLPGGGETVIRGQSHITRPVPPDLPLGAERVANIFVPYFSDGSNAEVFPIQETAAQAKTATTPGRIPQTLERLRAGQPVKIVCWGDSVTVGGDATSPETRYVAVFEKMLRERFPKADLHVETVAVGGSNSRQWLYPDKFHHASPEAEAQIRWSRVIDAKPNLVTVEFVNDAGMKAEDVPAVYGDILRRLRAIGAEVILITPHFTRMEMMKFKTLREPDQRPYVLALRKFANENQVALADASARWEHLWKEGIPYITLLDNGINHPDDRGHRIFAEELIKCFEP